jgi:hypothetical protein
MEKGQKIASAIAATLVTVSGLGIAVGGRSEADSRSCEAIIEELDEVNVQLDSDPNAEKKTELETERDRLEAEHKDQDCDDDSSTDESDEGSKEDASSVEDDESDTDDTSDNGDADVEGDEGNGTLSDEDLEALIALLTVNTVTANDCVSLEEEHGADTAMSIGNGNAVYKWHIGALEPVSDGGRLWSDAVSVPFKATEMPAMLTELQLGHCIDPLLGCMTGNYFAGLTVGGVDLLELNPWFEPFVGEPEETINGCAAEFVPLLDVEDPSEEQVEEANEAQLEWQVVAAKLNTLLERIQLLGVEARASSLNYHLVAGGLVVGGLPAVGYNDVQEDLPALVFVVTRKDNCPLLAIGYNTGDKRLEEFQLPDCVPPPCEPCPSPSTTITPPCDNCTTTTTQPPCTQNCSPPPGCTQNCEPPPCQVNCTPPPCEVDCEPPVTEPPCELCPKIPGEDVDVNPEVPGQVQGPGTTPIGEDPGPATAPVDSPTGCNGSCVSTTSSTTVAPSAGSGTSGDGSSLPSGGNAGVSNPEPAVSTTSSLPPATGDPGGF